MSETTRNNPTPGTQPREKSILIPMTFEQKKRLTALAKSLRLSQAALVRLLIDEKFVKQSLTPAGTLADSSQSVGDR